MNKCPPMCPCIIAVECLFMIIMIHRKTKNTLNLLPPFLQTCLAPVSYFLPSSWVSPFYLVKTLEPRATHRHEIISICHSLHQLTGAKAFTIYNTQHSLCLEEAAVTGQVVLKRCNLDSESQQWTWTDEGMLMCVASSRCLSASQNEPVKTLSCEGLGADSNGLIWDCDRNGLISRSTSMLLSVDGQRLTWTHGGKNSKWKSLEKADICQEKVERKFWMVTGTRVLCFQNITFRR